MLKSTEVKLISVEDWNTFIQETYGKIYNFQQQEGCKGRGVHMFSLPLEDWELEEEDEMFESIPEVINGEKIGVKFNTWLSRDIKTPLNPVEEDKNIVLFWERSFYPNFYTLLDDLFKKGLISKGDYIINIDW